MTLDFINKSIELRNPPLFHVISTFAGGGGSSTGYVWAGGKVRLAVEWDDNAVKTYRANYPHTPIYHGDIAKLSVAEALDLAGVQPGELDIFDGSPPCQGFSIAGKRQIDDPRNQLFREYVRLLRGIMPKVFVMENVSGMVKGKMKLLFVEILKELKASGYQVKAQLMNAMYFGVPQSRERLIFIGVRNDLGIQPSFPKAQTAPIKVRDALKDVPQSNCLRISDRLVRYWHMMQKGQSVSDVDPKGNGFSTFKIRDNSPSPTIVKRWSADNGLMHYEFPRFLSDAEIKRLGSFPDSYYIEGDSLDVIHRIGNSVPPRFMQAIAEHIYAQILETIS